MPRLDEFVVLVDEIGPMPGGGVTEGSGLLQAFGFDFVAPWLSLDAD